MNKKLSVILIVIMVLITNCFFVSCGEGGSSDKGTEDKVSEKHSYVLVDEESYEPTCTHDGQRVFKCSKCGKKKIEKIRALGHDYGGWEIIEEPDCSHDGKKKRVCSRCHKEDIEYINSIPHQYKLVEGIDSDCEHTGYHKYRCSICGEEYIAYDEAMEHIPEGEGKLIKEPTCKEKGKMRFHCKVCGKDYDVDVEPVGHDFHLSKTVDATCDNFGYKEYTCSRSGCTEKKYEFTEQKKEHNFDENGVCTHCHKHVTEAMPFNTYDKYNYSFVERDEEFGYRVHAKDNTVEHQLIMPRYFVDKLVAESIYELTIQFGSPDDTYRSFGYKTQDMTAYSCFNNCTRGYGDNTECFITFAHNGVIDEKVVSDEGLVIDVIYMNFGNPQIGMGSRDEPGSLSDYIMRVKYHKTYNENKPETWIKSDLDIKYANSEWIFTKDGNLNGYVKAILAPEYISALMDSGIKSLTFEIRGKERQGIAASVFDDLYVSNLKLTFTLELTENMKTEGLELKKLYIADLYGSWWNPDEPANGFILKISGNN